MDSFCPKSWVEICMTVCREDAEKAEKLAQTLWKRHGLPGVKIYLLGNEVVVSHAGGFVGLESGWERI